MYSERLNVISARVMLALSLIALFTVEQLVNGIVNGFDHPEPPQDDLSIPAIDANSTIPRVQP